MVDVPYSNMARIWTPTCEWYVVRYESKNGHQKGMYIKEPRLRAQIMPTILGPIINKIFYLIIEFLLLGPGGGGMWPLNEHENLHYDN